MNEIDFVPTEDGLTVVLTTPDGEVGRLQHMGVGLMSETNCIVLFCRRQCKILPQDAEVNRASGRVPCSCGRELRNHQTFAYPSGMNHVVRDCEGRFWHL